MPRPGINEVPWIQKHITQNLFHQLNFAKDIAFIRNKFTSASYPIHFDYSIIPEFTAFKENEDNKFIIPPCFSKFQS